MSRAKAIIGSAIAGLIAVAATGPAAAGDRPAPEKCYGIAKASKNDCQTASNACSGQVAGDAVGDAWVYLPRGTCERIVGASLTPKAK
jgi:uncharacterized membrane protein